MDSTFRERNGKRSASRILLVIGGGLLLTTGFAALILTAMDVLDWLSIEGPMEWLLRLWPVVTAPYVGNQLRGMVAERYAEWGPAPSADIDI